MQRAFHVAEFPLIVGLPPDPAGDRRLSRRKGNHNGRPADTGRNSGRFVFDIGA
jgi:hypothetical protein